MERAGGAGREARPLWRRWAVGFAHWDHSLTIAWPQSRLTGKDPDAGKGRGQEEKGVSEDEVVGRHHQLDGRGFDQTPGGGEGGAWCAAVLSKSQT